MPALLSSPPPRAALWLEVARALGGLVATPWRAAEYLVERDALREELLDELARGAAPEEPRVPALPAEPLTVLVSCAEPSGETHALSLVRALRAVAQEQGAPAPRLLGCGGARLADEGVELFARPVERAAMGFAEVGGALPYWAGLLTDAARRFRDERPDVFVPLDSPALHVPMARIAKRYGVPAAHFITPQYWGWAPWRVRGYARAVERALTILPFEPAWFARRGVAAVHVGHPLLDALGPAPAPAEGDALVLLPGSRAGVIRQNLPWMLRAVARELPALGQAPVRVVQSDATHAELARTLLAASPLAGRAELVTGDLHAALADARMALSVSGTVLIDLLHHRLPAVVVYRLASRRLAWMSRHLLTAPWFASVNLLAGRELYPEFCFRGEGDAAAVGAALRRCYNDQGWRRACVLGLDQAARRLGPPGAARRAAAAALELAAATCAERTEKTHGSPA